MTRMCSFAAICVSWAALALAAPSEPGHGSYGPIEAAFALPDLKGNPFDYTVNDVIVRFACPGGRSATVPAFFDGGKTWRVRYTPALPGEYKVQQITINGKPAEGATSSPDEFHVTGAPGPGFVRIDPAHKLRFAFDNGEPYYPLGYNLGWVNARGLALPESLALMGQNGGNWARIWMCHFSQGMNLDWPPGSQVPLGELSLDVARRWDKAVAAAQQHGVYLQIALQHHGQYSTQTNPNWSQNPWNKGQSGWLESPEAFFTDPRAIALTKAKYRYIVARWGYSPHILAWELFNEVEWTDAMKRNPAAIAAWHREMAAFLRRHDPNHHLVTTSSCMEEAAVWQDLDYYQPHAYPPDAVSAIARIDNLHLQKPYFFGEIGPGGSPNDDGRFLHRALWGSLMSHASGAAQYWYWDRMTQPAFSGQLHAAARFVGSSQLLRRADLQAASLRVECEAQGPLEFGPGGKWEKANQTEFTVRPSGEVPGIAEMPPYLHGRYHADLFPACTFRVAYAAPGKFVVRIAQVAKAGARINVTVDGATRATKDFPAASRDQTIDAALEVDVPQGEHAIGVSNSGNDWVVLKGFRLDPYLPALGALGKANDSYAVLWVYNRAEETAQPAGAKGKVSVAGMKPGAYRVVWYDTRKGEAMDPETVNVAAGEPLQLGTPAIARDMAVWVSVKEGP